jgi:hypothetical protein
MTTLGLVFPRTPMKGTAEKYPASPRNAPVATNTVWIPKVATSMSMKLPSVYRVRRILIGSMGM